jgi:hypothetical protein
MSNESGEFYYPLDEHHLSINFNDAVIVSWTSTFAEELLIRCHEGITGGENYSQSRLRLLLMQWFC